MLYFPSNTFRFQEIVNKFENSLQLPEDLDRAKGTSECEQLMVLENLMCLDYCRLGINLSLCLIKDRLFTVPYFSVSP